MQAIKDYENNKWKVIGQKVGKPAKVRKSGFLSVSLTCFLFGLLLWLHSHYAAVPVLPPFAIYLDFPLRHHPRLVMCRRLEPDRPLQARSLRPRNTASAFAYSPRRQAELTTKPGMPAYTAKPYASDSPSILLHVYTATRIPNTWTMPFPLPAFLISPHVVRFRSPFSHATITTRATSSLDTNGELR